MYKDTMIHHSCDNHQLVNSNISHFTSLIIFGDQQSRRGEDNFVYSLKLVYTIHAHTNISCAFPHKKRNFDLGKKFLRQHSSFNSPIAEKCMMTIFTHQQVTGGQT